MNSNKLKTGILLMTLSSFLTVIGQLLWDFGKSAGSSQDYMLIFFGFALYGLGSLLMIYSFKYGELSILYPVMGTSYIFSLIVGRIVLGEPLTVPKIIGTGLILIGISLIGKGEKEDA